MKDIVKLFLGGLFAVMLVSILVDPVKEWIKSRTRKE